MCRLDEESFNHWLTSTSEAYNLLILGSINIKSSNIKVFIYCTAFDIGYLIQFIRKSCINEQGRINVNL